MIAPFARTDVILGRIASAMVVAGDRIDKVRLAVNATPRRLKNIETAIVGKAGSEKTADMAGKMAVEGAQTLRHNGYKVPLMRNLVQRAIRGVTGATTT